MYCKKPIWYGCGSNGWPKIEIDFFSKFGQQWTLFRKCNFLPHSNKTTVSYFRIKLPFLMITKNITASGSLGTTVAQYFIAVVFAAPARTQCAQHRCKAWSIAKPFRKTVTYDKQLCVQRCTLYCSLNENLLSKASTVCYK